VESGADAAHKIRRLAIALAIYLTLIGVVASASGLAVAAPQPISTGNFALDKGDAHPSLLSELDHRLGGPRSVADILGETNHAWSACSSGVPHMLRAYCWAQESGYNDQDTTKWIPQGLTTSADAQPDATWGQNKVVMVSWYHNEDNGAKGVRVSFVNVNNLGAPSYRNVLLVEPRRRSDGTPDFDAVPIHAGGLAWYQHYLYVVDTWGGLRVFDLDHIWRLRVEESGEVGLGTDGRFHAFGYLYVLPQAFRYNVQTPITVRPFRFSSVGLDRTSTPDSLVVTEFREAGSSDPARTLRYGLDSQTGRLRESVIQERAIPSEGFDVDVDQLQGGVSINGRFYFSKSAGRDNRGDLIRFRPQALAIDQFPGALPIGTEDLSYWPARDQLWGLGEYAVTRRVVAVSASAYTP
jgi:hypothetical protein